MDIFAAIERLGLPVVLLGLAGYALYKLIDRMSDAASRRSATQDKLDEKQIDLIGKFFEQSQNEQAYNRSLQERWFADQKISQDLQRALTDEFKRVGVSLENTGTALARAVAILEVLSARTLDMDERLGPFLQNSIATQGKHGHLLLKIIRLLNTTQPITTEEIQPHD